MPSLSATPKTEASHLLTPRPRLTSASRDYLFPENFRERNLQLIQSIKDFLQSDEARFIEFKSHSGEFRKVRLVEGGSGGWEYSLQPGA